MSAFVVKSITVSLCQKVVGMHNICKVTEVKNRPFKAYGQCRSALCGPFKCPSSHIFRRTPAVFILILLQPHLLLMYVFLSCRRVVPNSVLVPHSPKLRPPTSPFDWELGDWRCVMRPRSSHIHHDVTVSNPDLNYLRLASFQHML